MSNTVSTTFPFCHIFFKILLTKSCADNENHSPANGYWINIYVFVIVLHKQIKNEAMIEIRFLMICHVTDRFSLTMFRFRENKEFKNICFACRPQAVKM